MKTTKTIASVSAVAVVLSAFAVGCSSTPSGSSTSTASDAVNTVQNPTGSFNESNASGAFGSYSNNKDASSGLASSNAGASDGSSTSSQSLHVLANTVQSSACTEGETCACPAGGTYSYTKETNDYGPTVHASFAGCFFSTGSGFDGDAVLLVADSPILKDAKLADPTVTISSILFGADGTFTSPTETVKAKVVFLAERAVDYLAVQVADGTVIIGVRNSDGMAIVYAKGETWLCTPGNGAYACTEETSGKTLQASSGSAAPSQSTGPAPGAKA